MQQISKVLLVIGGGIAAYKCLELIRIFSRSGIQVTPVLTKAAQEFVTPLSVSALAANKAFTELFDLNDESEMGHIELSRAADIVVVAPATADLIGKMANGLANDLASTVLMATDKPVMIAPAMNVRMWEHPATQRNIAQLEQDGIGIIGPDKGDMACGEFGLGRMAEPAEIARAVLAKGQPGPLAGRHVLVTSGPTHEPIDPVRYIANRSSGTQGAAIARALLDLGARVSFVTGPASAARPNGAQIIEVETAAQMLEAVNDVGPVDVAIFAAAVADWRVDGVAENKIKKQNDGALPVLSFSENTDILQSVAKRTTDRPRLVVGFAAETQNVAEYARNKLDKKGCDWILANDVSPETGIMGGQNNTVVFVTKTGAETWPEMSKTEVGQHLAQKIVEALR